MITHQACNRTPDHEIGNYGRKAIEVYAVGSLADCQRAVETGWAEFVRKIPVSKKEAARVEKRRALLASFGVQYVQA